MKPRSATPYQAPGWKFLFLALTAGLAPAEALAGKNTGIPECPAPSGNQYMIRDFTNYSPRGARGTMNGKCEQSNVYKDALDEKRGGPMKHGACNYELEDHLAGKTNAVMGAVPLKGKASNLLGAIYKGIALDKAIGSSGTYIYVGDTYGKGWHTRECKMDIITKAVKSELTDKVNRAKGGELIKLARGEIPSPSRKVPRDPGALESVEPLAQNELASAKEKPVAKSKYKTSLKLPDEGPIPEFNPRKIDPEATAAYDQIEAAKAKMRMAPAVEQPAGQWSGTTTEDIDAYYDNFTLTPKVAPKTDRLKRKPASQPTQEELLKNFNPERFGD
jgi:hypothetical protein